MHLILTLIPQVSFLVIKLKINQSLQNIFKSNYPIISREVTTTYIKFQAQKNPITKKLAKSEIWNWMFKTLVAEARI